MVELYFSDRFENDTLIATCPAGHVMKHIQDFINKCNEGRPIPFVMYYHRTWRDGSNDKKIWYDVGSHSEFFYTIEVEDE